MKNIPTAWCRDGIFGVMRGVGYAPDIVFSLMAKKLNFCLIWPEYLLPYVWGVPHMHVGEHQTCLLLFFFKQRIFFWPLFRKAQPCDVYRCQWSYGQILKSHLWSFAAPSGLSLVFLLPLPGQWVLVGGPLLTGLMWCHILNLLEL